MLYKLMTFVFKKETELLKLYSPIERAMLARKFFSWYTFKLRVCYLLEEILLFLIQL